MSTTALTAGTVHTMPKDWQQALIDNKLDTFWEDLTPLARNEWICWIDSAKKEETRAKRITVGISKMKSGERRPCCWIGCIHRTDKEISPSVKAILARSK
ncbi:MAG: YdeI/OmpD-associated family protein [Candidatus Saccharimonadales bacterium]